MGGRMADGATSSETRYGAFISYSHADTAFARRLHRRLETYRLPRRLVHRTADGAAPSRRLKPIFRDRDEFTAASDLTEAVREAIAESGCLIVVCSPAAAASEWVDLEIRLFRGLHGDHGILAALHRGEPAEAIPAAMTEGGDVLGHAHQPLAADFRRDADGEHLALLKLVAVLAGVRLDQLVQRDAQRRIRRMGAIGAGSLFGMAAAGVLAFAAIEGRIAAEHERARSQGVVDYMLTDLRGKLKGVGRLDALDAVNKGAMGYYRGQNLTKLPISAQLQSAEVGQQSGSDDVDAGNYTRAHSEFKDALCATFKLYQNYPDNSEVVFGYAQSVYWDGFMDWRAGDDSGALKRFQEYAMLAEKLRHLSLDIKYWLELPNAYSNLGVFRLRSSMDTRGARAFFRSAQEQYEAAGRRYPLKKDIRNSIADGHAWLGDVERLSGNYVGARKERALERQTLNALQAGNHLDFELRSALIGNQLGVARISAAEGDLEQAAQQLRQGYRDAVVLLAVEPNNREIADQARVIELFQARVWMAMPLRERPPAAVIDAHVGDCAADERKPQNEELATFCSSLRLRRRSGPTKVDPLNARLRLERRNFLTERWRLSDVEEDSIAT